MRVALVTGAARGIGAATVEVLCDQGYAVTALDVCGGGNVPAGVGYPLATPEDLQALADRFPGHVLPVEADVRDPEAMHTAVNATMVRFGRLDDAIAIAPGSTRTAMLAATADLYATTPAGLAEHQGIRRLIEPEEIAQAIALCCSPAGAALNGSAIRADGGFSE